MKKRDMLLGGPGHDGYGFNADVYCVDCGREIINKLPDVEYDDLDFRDMDKVPQPIFFGESDSAQYCGNCGEYLYGPIGEGEI